MAKQKLSQEMIDNINNYGNEIQTLETFVQQVRQNPGYHLGAIGNKGLINMIREVLQNSLDELDKESSPCSEVFLSFDESIQTTTVIDNGRGIPFDNMVRIFATSSTSSNYTKKKGEYSSGLHGVGAKVTNAMSSKFIVESYILGKGRRVEFTEGYPWNKGSKGEVDIKSPSQYQGTFVTFTPSVTALGDTNVTWQEVHTLACKILPLCKIGAVLHFNGIDANGNQHNEDIVNTDGIMTFLKRQVVSPIINPIEIHKDTGFMKMDIAFTWDSSESSMNRITSFANKCPTTLGTHIDGFDKGITQYFVNFMNKIYLAGPSKKKISCVPVDIRSGLQAVVSVAHLKPIFDGQSKEKLSNDEMEPFVASGIMEALDQWQKANPKDMAKICKYFKDIAELRLSVDNKRIKITDQYSKSKLTNLPSKYVAPTGNPNKVKTELFIVEGDSAAGHIKNHRVNERQGYFPIRGKLPNAFNTSRDKFLANAEIAGLIAIIGGGYGKTFDINKVKWDKIIICTDADSDGAHIAVLIMRFMILYMPGIIEAGKLYRTVPPLYSVGTGKNIKYMHDKSAYIKYFQASFLKNHVISDYKGNKLSNKETTALLYKNTDYVYEMDKIKHIYAADPILLEIILTSYINREPFSKLQKAIKKEAKFIEKVEQRKDGVIVIEGLYNSKYQSIFINERMMNECKRLLDILSANTSFVYMLNGKLVTLYELMNEFDKSLPSQLQRYKGLGEMDADELFDSTLNPDNRILIQYTIESLKEELDAIKYYENNNFSELMTGVKVTRADLLS